jgi:hypothetical protein
MVLDDQPHVFRAHQLRFSCDVQQRLLLEARLLTREPLDQIAVRFATEPNAVVLYENLFFNVLDRLQCRDWIAKAVLRPPPEIALGSGNHILSDEEAMGYVLRFFAYHGGPLVLDAMIDGMLPKGMPAGTEDLARWFEKAVAGVTRTRAAAAASVLQIDKSNSLRLVKLAIRIAQSGKPAKAGRKESRPEPDVKKILEALDQQWEALSPTGQS